MTAVLIVRAVVDPNRRDDFDTWYENEHLPDAHKAFSPLSANRGWCKDDPNTHIAVYEFSSLGEATKAIESQAIKELIIEFDRHWDGFVTRTREVIEFKQSL
jgi:hypothetical protein